MVFEQTIKLKVHFAAFKAFLRNLNIRPTGLSFVDVISDVNSKTDKGVINEDALNFELTDFVKQYLLFGRKIVYSISMNNPQIEEVISAIDENGDFQTLTDKVSNLELFSQSELSRMTLNNSSFIYATKFNDTICLLFANKHAIASRIPLSINDLKKNSDDFDQIYGIKKRHYQSFDSIIIDPERRTIDFCIDNAEGLSQKIHYEYFAELRSKFISLFEFDFEDFKITRNYFKLVDKYYNSEIGVVKELSFRTNTGSRKTEEMTENSTDLRHELFHSSGVGAIDKITPFSIKMVIENTETKNTITHLIPGRPQTLNTARPEINFYEIYGANKYEDYSFIKFNIDELLIETIDV